MLVSLLVLSVVEFLLLVGVIGGLWDVYKTQRAIQSMIEQRNSNEASEHLQQIGRDEERLLKELKQSRKRKKSP